MNDTAPEHLFGMPSFDTCKEHVEDGTATMLERFILDNEPGGHDEEKLFRIGLAFVVQEAQYTGMNVARELVRAHFESWHKIGLAMVALPEPPG